MHAPLGGACQAEKTPASAARPRPSVEKPTVRTDRPHGPDAVRLPASPRFCNLTIRSHPARQKPGSLRQFKIIFSIDLASAQLG
jgi:hypothetical protein